MAQVLAPAAILLLTLGAGIGLLVVSFDGTVDDNTKTDLIIAGSVLLVVFVIGTYLFFKYVLKFGKVGGFLSKFFKFKKKVEKVEKKITSSVPADSLGNAYSLGVGQVAPVKPPRIKTPEQAAPVKPPRIKTPAQ